MSHLQIGAHRKLPEFLVTTKEVGSASATVQTPSRSRPIAKFEDGEELLDSSYGFAEVHMRVSTQDLKELAEGSKEALVKSINDQKSLIREDEIPFVVIEYTGRGIVNIPGLEVLVQTLDEHFDVIIGLLMSEQLDSTDLDANPEPYNRFIENTERFLGAIKKVATESATLGSIPVLSQERMEEVFNILLAEDVDGFCLDFLGKKPTARQRINQRIAPLIRRMGRERCYRTSLLYAVNTYRGQNRTGTPRSSAEDFFVFTLGIDVLGDQYYFPRDGWSGEDEIQFRWFDSETYEQEYVPVNNLRSELPKRTGLSHDYIMELARDDEHRGRTQVLLEVEQMNVAYDELREAIQDGRTAEFVTEKAGTIGRIETQMKTIQEAYDDGRSSPPVTSF